jgi:predicted TIM-barrel fold metal-dependent hydrolase
MIVDSHTHVMCRDRGRYPVQPMGLGSDWWETGGDVSELTGAMDANGIDRAVIVQSMAVYQADCRCALDTVAANRQRFALVTGVDMDGEDPAATVRAHAELGATGVRLLAFRSRSSAWLVDRRGREVWEAAAKTGVVIVAMGGPEQYDDLASLCASVPGARVALDHAGSFRQRDDAGLFRLAQTPSVHLKVTTTNLQAPDAREWFERLVDAYGADRLCWGSDFPQTTVRPYAAMLELARAATAGLDEEQRARYFGGNSARLWWP